MFLGEAQSKSNKLPEAVQTYEKGIQVAQSLVSGLTLPGIRKFLL